MKVACFSLKHHLPGSPPSGLIHLVKTSKQLDSIWHWTGTWFSTWMWQGKSFDFNFTSAALHYCWRNFNTE